MSIDNFVRNPMKIGLFFAVIGTLFCISIYSLYGYTWFIIGFIVTTVLTYIVIDVSAVLSRHRRKQYSQQNYVDDELNNEDTVSLFNVTTLANCPPVDHMFNYYYMVKPSVEETDRFNLAIMNAFNMANINLWFNRVHNNAKHSVFYYKLENTKISEQELLRYVEVIERELGVYGINIDTRTGESNIVAISVPHGKNKKVGMLNALEDENFQEFLVENLRDYKLEVLPVVFGQQQDGTLAFADLHTCPSLLIAGSSGSGKSTLLHGILSVLLSYNTPETLELYLMDTKIVELAAYEEFPHVKRFATDADHFADVLHEVLEIINVRYQAFQEVGAKEINEFNRLVANNFRFPFTVLVIEELGDLMLDSDNKVQKELIRILQKGRACGVHVIALTQRPDSKIINSSIKANMPCRVALRVASSTDSRIIINRPGAEDLRERGEMIVYTGGNYTRCSGILVERDEIKKIERFWATQPRSR